MDQELIPSHIAAPVVVLLDFKFKQAMTHAPETGAENQLHFSAPENRRRFLETYTSGMKISGAKINMAVNDVNDERTNYE